MRGPEAARFSPDWLALRSTYDERSRADELVPLLVRALSRSGGALRFTDLASGTAANFLYLAPRIAKLAPLDQKWRLVDRDPLVLDRASQRIADQARANGWTLETEGDEMVLRVDDRRWTVTFDRIDLARELETLVLADAEAIVVSALLDLVSPAWLQRFVGWAASARSPILSTLIYDGSLGWQPEDREDDRMRALFNDHQRRDKGFGPALGPAAPSWLVTRLMTAGYLVEQRPSPWRLGPEDVPMLNALIETISGSAAEQDPQARRLAAAWAARRKTHASAAILSGTIGHVDVLARL